VVRSARVRDIDAILALWKEAGLRLRVAEQRSALKIRLRRDRDLFLVAVVGGHLVGSLIAGWDGWRGSMARLAVAPSHRRRRIAQRLVRTAEARLKKRGARRIGALIFADNRLGKRFWSAEGYRTDNAIRRMVKNRGKGTFRLDTR
jgi:ribosomal protein S18 acetylase RimI-like enzyme